MSALLHILLICFVSFWGYDHHVGFWPSERTTNGKSESRVSDFLFEYIHILNFSPRIQNMLRTTPYRLAARTCHHHSKCP
jgi:hypothetical protein